MSYTLSDKKKLVQEVTANSELGDTATHTLICLIGTSYKFYQLQQEGDTVAICYGKIGTPGNYSHKELRSEAAAVKFMQEKLAEKLKKGYESPSISPSKKRSKPKKLTPAGKAKFAAFSSIFS